MQNKPLTEEVQCSDLFAAMLLESENGQMTEIDVDDHLAMLDRMIAEAEAKGNGKATQ